MIANAEEPQPTAELVSLAWRRIQIVIRLRPTAPTRLVPTALRLQRLSEPAVEMPPTAAETDDGHVVARFNVMQGPGQMPLEPGRWALVQNIPGRPNAPIRCLGANAPDLSQLTARFATERGEYSVRPTIAETDAVLGLEVTLDPSIQPSAERRRPVVSLSRRIVRRLRMHLFQLLLRLFTRVNRRNGRRILFMSHYGTDFPGDMQAIFARMAERGLDREYEVHKIPPRRVRSLRAWLSMAWLLSRADTIVIDEDAFDIQQLDARIIQLWHASGALKLIGYSRIGKPGLGERGELGAWSRKYKRTTYAIVSGEHDVPLFAEAFGIPEDRVIPTGHPRMDRFFDESYRAQARETTLQLFPQARGRMLILFAPTWRMSRKGRAYDLGVLDFQALHDLCVEKNAVFVIRLHPTVEHTVDIPERYRDRILDGTSGVMDAPDILCATDLLITDYSSIILEYSLLGRPMLFFAHDLEDYVADRDLYMPYEEYVPGRIVRSFDELVEAIRRDDYGVEEVAEFARRHFSHFDSGATDRVIDLILGEGNDTGRSSPSPSG